MALRRDGKAVTGEVGYVTRRFLPVAPDAMVPPGLAGLWRCAEEGAEIAVTLRDGAAQATLGSGPLRTTMPLRPLGGARALLDRVHGPWRQRICLWLREPDILRSPPQPPRYSSRDWRGSAHAIAPPLTLWSALALMAFGTGTVQAQTPPAARVLRVAPHADLRTLDPVFASIVITRMHGLMIYETLLPETAVAAPAADGGGWSVSPDELTWTLLACARGCASMTASR